MPFPLSYPGLRCVLEHLEAVKRAHIIARAPGLQKINKLIPLCLENFCIDSNEVSINKLSIKCNKKEVKFQMNGKTFSYKGLVSCEYKMKKLINYYICGRSIIHMDSLDWCDSFLPDDKGVNLKFRVNSLKAHFPEDFKTVIPLIDPRSFPLKTLVTIPNTSTFDSQIVQLAETVILNFMIDQIVTVEDLKKLNNKTVIFERFSFSRIEMIPLIKHHVETKKDIGTTFMILSRSHYFIGIMLREFKQAFGDFRSDLDGVNERFIPGSLKFCIPINKESRIQVYTIEDPDERGRLKVVVKPVSEISGI
ncbi:hypothetical protein GCK72_007951 [Caenorhabditis remanei]|uniref:DUF38 domain-containing protein n=1 Tax=Caenorhabditis remanei TaxID=31234 RepID=A0A6A5HIK4_CAERE|nr:hypothetical protein GCK72_007951 [Caenorhabditis remanei]KAF1767990.1 hypothetical protein GCK72_007951 [Caenorhabditis remanei]